MQLKSVGAGFVLICAVAMTFVVWTDLRGQESTQGLTYARGQSVIPAYDGWTRNPDGTIDMWFGYLNRNWQERLDVPIGPDNNITPPPLGPDAGQPTHFLPRHNRWQFAVRVPSEWDPTGEVVWTVRSQGRTYSAHGTLKPDYFMDNYGRQRESSLEFPPRDNTPPVLRLEGDTQRTAKVGQPVTLAAVATDDGLPQRTPARRSVLPGGFATTIQRGGGTTTRVAFGLRLAWLKYRGAGTVTFDPPQFKVWEDERGGSPWADGWEPPPVPPGNRWVAEAIFHDPGVYVVRAQASDGLLYTTANITFIVTA